MSREGSLEEISDGKLYRSSDMVKIDCHDCRGCSDCCHGLCDLIILDPYDIFQLERSERQSFEELLQGKIELNVVEGLILPNLKPVPETDHCAFLNEQGMCGIHGYRPGICRLYPLGRYYENHKLHYILQTGECERSGKTKVKISKWLGIPQLAKYEQYILRYHDFLKALREQLDEMTEDAVKSLNLYLLQTFFQRSYDMQEDFFEQFLPLLEQAERLYGINTPFGGEDVHRLSHTV